jgi:hypothetical protein
MRKNIASAIMVVVLSAGMALAQGLPGTYAYSTNSASYGFRVKYNGSASTAYISNIVNVVKVVDGDITNTITITPTTRADSVLASIVAATNVDSVANFQAELLAYLPGDTASNLVAASAVSLLDGKWTEVLKVDTGSNLQWNAVSYGDNVPDRWLSKIYGCPQGVGDVTLTAYIDSGSGYLEVFKKVITSPVYAFGQISTTTNTNTAVNVVNVFESLTDNGVYGIRVPAKAKCLVRAARGTSISANGSIGAMFTVK